MSWARIDDDLHDSAKVAVLSDAAFRLWSMALCWSYKKENEKSEGFIPEALLSKISEGRWPKKKLTSLAEELVRSGIPVNKAGLWETVDGGWQIHDWDQYRQSSHETKMSREESARLAGQKSAQVRRERNGTAQPGGPTTERPPPNEPERSRVVRDSFDERRSNARSSNETPNVRTPDPDPDPRTNTPLPPHDGDGGNSLDSDDPMLPCPSRLATDELVQELANHYQVTPESIRAAEQSFKTYWTVSGGAGARFRRGMWIRKFRQRVQVLHDRDELGPTLKAETPGIRPVTPEQVAARKARDEAAKLEARRKLGLA